MFAFIFEIFYCSLLNCISPQALYVDQSKYFKGGFFRFFLFMYIIHYYVICRPSDSTVPEDAGIEPKTVATLALTARSTDKILISKGAT
jgi:hypothetical protein